jgi:hypothetical protein
VWSSDDNIQQPYLENDDNSDLSSISAVEEQQNPLEYHPTIWFDDDIYPSLNYNIDNQEDNFDDDSAININYPGPELPTIEHDEGGGNQGIYLDDDTIQNTNDNND